MDQVRQILLLVLFSLIGAASTVVAWFLFPWILQPVIPPPFETLACLLAGLMGPLVVWLAVYLGTRRTPPAVRQRVVAPATIGLSLALATQLAFYVPLGFLATAFASS